MTLRILIIGLISCANIYAQDKTEISRLQDEATRFIGIDNKKAENLFKKAFKLSEDIDYNYGMGVAAYGLAETNTIQEKFSKAIHFLLVAKKHFTSIEDFRKLKKSLVALGSIYSFLDDAEGAITYLNEAMNVNAIDVPMDYYANYYLALAYLKAGKKDSALKLAWFKNLPEEKRLLGLKHSFSAHIFVKAGDYINAISFAKKSIELDKSDLNLSMCYNNLADSYLATNDLDRALTFTKLSFKCKSEIYKGDTYRILAFIHIGNNELENAEETLKKSYVTNGNSNLDVISEGYSKLSAKYKEKGHFEKSIEFLEISKDMLNEKMKKMKELEKEVRLAGKVTNDFTTREMLASLNILRQRNFFAIVIIILLTGITFYGVLIIIKNKNYKNKHKDDLLGEIKNYKGRRTT